MNDRDIDAEFDAIVAHWGDDASMLPKPRTVQDITAAYAALSRPETDSPSPSDESTAEDAPSNGTAEGQAVAETPTEPEAEPEAWRAGPSVHDEDDHFEPPPVHLPPGEDIGYWGALIGLIGGPLVLLWVVLTTPFYGGWWTLGAILMFFGGFALLVLRQPRDRDPFDGDDGARV